MNQPILIQGAMKVETEYLIEKLVDSEKIILNSYEYYKGFLNNISVVISITKVGTVNSAVSTILAIKEFNPILVINQGVAGGYGNNIHKGDIVIAKSVYNMSSYRTQKYKENEGIHPNEWIFLDWNDGEKKEKEKITADISLLNKFKKILTSNYNGTIHTGNVLSGDAWNNEIDRIRWFIDYFDAMAEDMESYSVYKVCSDNKIPVLGVRMISNNIINQEEYNKSLASDLQKLIFDNIKSII